MKKLFILFSILFALIVTFTAVSNVHAQSQTCYKDGCGPNTNAKYEYTPVTCQEICNPPFGCSYVASDGVYRSHETSSLEFQNTPFGWQCAPPGPDGNCQDYDGFGGLTDCGFGIPGDPPGCSIQITGWCEGNFYNDYCCEGLPSSCHDTYGCGEGGGGGGGPTPTPTPYCNLSCPGQSLSDLNGGSVNDVNDDLGGLGGATVRGATTLLAQAQVDQGSNTVGGGSLACGALTTSGINDKNNDNTTFAFGRLEGDLVFNGYNGFVCQTLLSCLEDPQECPESTAVEGSDSNTVDGGGNSVKGAFTQVLGAASDDPRVSITPFGQVLGVVSSRLLAQAQVGSGSNSDTTVASETTWTESVTLNRLEGSEPTVYGYEAQNATGQSCGCQVVLGCYETQQPSPNSVEAEVVACNNECNFSFTAESEYPTTVDNVEVVIDANNGWEQNVTFDWDDGLGPQDVTGQTNISQLMNNAGSYDMTITCSNPGQGQQSQKTCTRRMSVYCEGTIPEELPTPTPTPPGAWIKLQDSSLNTGADIANPAPAAAEAFDETDTLACESNPSDPFACVISGEAGVATVRGNSANFGESLSDREWLRTDSSYSMNTLLNPSSYLEYARARKDVVDIDGVSNQTVQDGAINIDDSSGTVTLRNDRVADSISQPTVIVVDGDLYLDMFTEPDDTFNPENKPIAFIVTGTLGISEGTAEINGIFIANSVSYAYDTTVTTNPLKVNGNISSMTSTTPCHSKRQREDNENQPSCFFTFDFANQFLPLADMISTRTYEWTELVP